MNYRVVLRNIGTLLKAEAVLMILPLFISLIYKEKNYYAFLIPIGLLLIIGSILTLKKDVSGNIYAKEGFAIVGLSWIIVSVFGALPFVISGEINNFVDALFETVSGFTTTGSSILTNVEVLSKGIQFWRCFTIWIGGMGILVFILAILPQTNARSMFIIKAESPGPQVGKIVSRVNKTARILYGIYIFLTLLEMIMLSFKMPIYDSIVHSFATAGTGGFSIKNASIGFYNSSYVDYVITTFLILFGINFSIFYLIIIGKISKALKSEELRWYLFIIVFCVSVIVINTFSIYNNIASSFRYSSFQVVSIMTTAGFSTYDFNVWPTLSKMLLILLMFIGACAGSTGGGMKVSRFIIYIKMVIKEIRYTIHPRQVTVITFEKKAVDDSTIKGMNGYLAAYLLILFFATLIVSIDGKDLISTVTAVITCFNNIGPGLGIVGPTGNFASFSSLSKLTLTFSMLAGRLEIFPILILFSPKLWMKN